jgi:hypothetical protein
MLNRAALLSLVDEAARDPSGARRLLELAGAMLQEELQRGEYAMPSGYIYAGAHTWIASFEDVPPEPLPTAGDPTPQRDPLTNTANQPQIIEVPFDALILGVSGWLSSKIPDEADDPTLVDGLLDLSADPEGRDLFAVDWNQDGKIHYVTDGRVNLIEPATATVGTRTAPRPLGWVVRRNDRINVRVRNLTNVVVPFAWYEDQPEPYGWNIDCAIGFHALNLERP